MLTFQEGKYYTIDFDNRLIVFTLPRTSETLESTFKIEVLAANPDSFMWYEYWPNGKYGNLVNESTPDEIKLFQIERQKHKSPLPFDGKDMRKIQLYQAIISVDILGNGSLVKIPDDLKERLLYLNFDRLCSTCVDVPFTNVPNESGIYECKVEFWLSQRYDYGELIEGEDEWEFRIIKSKPLLDLSSLLSS